MRILVADDSATNRSIVTAVLRAADYQVDAVCDGASAIDAVAQADYDLVLMDIEMPGLDGYATVREIRRREAGQSSVRIAALSSRPAALSRMLGESAGMNGFIERPASARLLLEKIAIYVRIGNVARRATVWNTAVWHDLVDILGAERMVHHKTLFIAQAGAVTALLASVDCDRPKLQRLVHDLKSVAGMFGFEEVEGICQAMEIAWSEGGRPVVGLIEAIERAISATRGNTLVAGWH